MAGQCSGGVEICARNFRECAPCPFNEKDFAEGVIHDLDPIIQQLVAEGKRTGLPVGNLVYDMAQIGFVGNEAAQVRVAAEAKLQQ